NPHNTQAMVLVGRLDDAIAARPKDASLRRLRMHRALETGDTACLVEDARQLCALSGSDAESRYTLALAHVHAGEMPAGLAELRALLEHCMRQRARRLLPPADLT